ncbi:unnamed protein product [Leptosia nina]|uniref:Amine oxidase domain-containing protein n=1 Tax=Leptosia nina TaxID=320188 RepID=A0AAV1JMY2_9NEOP
MKLISKRIISKKCHGLFKRWKSDLGPQSDVFNCGPDLEDRGICGVEPCDPDKCYKEPRVVIVGAGMAGLPGGRILSCWLGDIVAELGASWKMKNTATHPLYTLSTSEDPPRPGVPGAEHPRGLFNSVVSGKMAFPPMISAYHKFRQIEEEAAQIYCLGGNKQQGSLINFMSLRIQQELHEYPEEQQHDAARIMFGLTHMLNARCGDDIGLLCADNLGCFMNMPGGDVRVPLGLVGILAPLLRQIPEGTIRYCKPVNCIYWGTCMKAGCRAYVYTADGEEFQADYVILTPSIGVLCSNAIKLFCPALPANKVEAIKCLCLGACNKVYLEYCRPFWYWHKGDLNFKFEPGNIVDRADWTRGIKSIEMVPNSKHVLSVVVDGPEAAVMENLCDKDVAEGVTQILRMFTGNPYIPYPVTILRSFWSSDPYFLGAYSSDCAKTDGYAQRTLACPVPGPSEPIPPILLFAGEATVAGLNGTVAGARLSGIREAERVVKLTLQYKGPPLPYNPCCTNIPQQPPLKA